MYILSRFLSVLAIVFALSGCNSNADNHEFFPGKYPGKPEISINNDEIEISNNAILAKWQLVNNSIVLSEIINKYDNELIHLQDITLFAVEVQGKRQLTNLDFKLQGELSLESIAVTDSLPTKALRFPGKQVSGLFYNESQQISIKWTAQLREGSNYLRQNIEIETIDKPAIITKVIFFDGNLSGASYAGLVLGSPITYKNFFFGMEHPIAQSEALMARSIGNVRQSVLDVTNIIDRAGKYLISIELAASTEFNINSMALAVNGEAVSEDKHPFQGPGGSAQYHLDLPTYDSLCKYEILTDLVNPQRAAGNLTIYRKTNDLLNFFIERTDELIPGKSISEWSVIGVTPKGQNRRAFLYYLERERARPYKQFLHYNCWWDITDDGASSFTSEQLIERMHAWNEKFIEPYDVQLNSFVFDDGWDNLDSVWYFDPDKFPDGFTPQAELCEKYNSGIGVWMSPFGGYLENKRRRVESAKREGLETNNKGLSLAGKNYYQRFYERASDMLNNYGVNYFKFDGFGGSEPAYLPDMEAGARLIKNLRKHNPDVFINITVGSWPSPFWLQYADCTWRGSGDAHMAGVGRRTQRFMTYRDGTMHNNIVKKAPYYPLNSLMVAGIAYANLGHPIKCINDSIGDFKDMVRSFFAAGSSLQELYISHDRMKDDFWPILAEAAKWANDNQSILKDTHWVGGSPLNLEVYGFASWTPEKGILTLRNPGDERIEFELSLDEALEIPVTYSGDFELNSPWEEDQDSKALRLNSSEKAIITIEPYELIVFEVTHSK